MRATVYKDSKRINGRAKKVVEELERKIVVNEGRIAMIQALIPLGLRAVEVELQLEVSQLVGGAKHERTGGSLKRWGRNPGSVFLGDQKVRVNVPRVRNTERNQEVPLKSYESFQNPALVDEMALCPY